MEENITPRQVEILKTIIAEYTQTGNPVGSEILDKKYNLGVSPATVRNEMVTLAKKGYLQKQHFSAGRIPTAKAFRFYIQNLMEEKELSTAEEVSYKADVWDHRDETNKLLQQAARILAKRTRLLAIATTNEGDIHYFGVPNILSHKEFTDYDLTCRFLKNLDTDSFFSRILDEFRKAEEDILFMLGDEESQDELSQTYAAVYGEFEGSRVRGAIGVLGPKRMHYEVVVPNVRYFTHLIEEILKEKGL